MYGLSLVCTRSWRSSALLFSKVLSQKRQDKAVPFAAVIWLLDDVVLCLVRVVSVAVVQDGDASKESDGGVLMGSWLATTEPEPGPVV
jgi:hypothetical protein